MLNDQAGILLDLARLARHPAQQIVSRATNHCQRRAQFVRDVGDKGHLRLGQFARPARVHQQGKTGGEDQPVQQQRHSEIAPAGGGHHGFHRAEPRTGFEDPQVPLGRSAALATGWSLRRVVGVDFPGPCPDDGM